MNVESGCIPDIEVVLVFMLSDRPGCEVLILSKTSTFHGSFMKKKLYMNLKKKGFISGSCIFCYISTIFIMMCSCMTDLLFKNLYSGNKDRKL